MTSIKPLYSMHLFQYAPPAVRLNSNQFVKIITFDDDHIIVRNKIYFSSTIILRYFKLGVKLIECPVTNERSTTFPVIPKLLNIEKQHLGTENSRLKSPTTSSKYLDIISISS